MSVIVNSKVDLKFKPHMSSAPGDRSMTYAGIAERKMVESCKTYMAKHNKWQASNRCDLF